MFAAGRTQPIGTKTAREMLKGARAVVIDGILAFDGDDRGGHLLAVLSFRADFKFSEDLVRLPQRSA
jgi:Lhr-like helicase